MVDVENCFPDSMGNLENFKITYPEDLLRVDKLIKGSNHD